MKKILTFLLLAAIPLVSSARYYDDKVSGWVYFFAVLFVVWGVLNIVLFFKLWKATDDIASIKDHFCDKENTEVEIKQSAEDKEVEQTYKAYSRLRG